MRVRACVRAPALFALTPGGQGVEEDEYMDEYTTGSESEDSEDERLVQESMARVLGHGHGDGDSSSSGGVAFTEDGQQVRLRATVRNGERVLVPEAVGGADFAGTWAAGDGAASD